MAAPIVNSWVATDSVPEDASDDVAPVATEPVNEYVPEVYDEDEETLGYGFMPILPFKKDLLASPRLELADIDLADSYHIAVPSKERAKLNPIYTGDAVAPVDVRLRWWSKPKQPITQPRFNPAYPLLVLDKDDTWEPDMFDEDEEKSDVQCARERQLSIIEMYDEGEDYPLGSVSPQARPRSAVSMPYWENAADDSPPEPAPAAPMIVQPIQAQIGPPRKPSFTQLPVVEPPSSLLSDIETIRIRKEKRRSSSLMQPVTISLPERPQLEHVAAIKFTRHSAVPPLDEEPTEPDDDDADSVSSSEAAVAPVQLVVKTSRFSRGQSVDFRPEAPAAPAPRVSTAPSRKIFNVVPQVTSVLSTRKRSSAQITPAPFAAVAAEQAPAPMSERCTYLGNCTCPDCRRL